jgi:RNA polymerase primary sigma factor
MKAYSKANNNYTNHRLITAQESDNLNRFFSDIKDHESLTSKEESELIVKIQATGDKQAMDRLIKANLRFVVTVAKTYQNQGVPLMDLIQEGCTGLVEATYKFDTNRKVKFFSYAVWWIKNYIINTFNLHKRLIQLPANRTLLILKLRRKVQELEEQLHRLPTLVELRKFFPGSSEDDLTEAFTFTMLPVSLQSTVFLNSGEDTQLVEVLSVENSLSIDDEDRQESLLTDLAKVLCQLPQLNYDVLVLSTGLNEEPICRPEKLAYLFELEQKVIARLKAKAIKFLKKYSEHTNLNEYL